MDRLISWATALGARIHKLTPQDRHFLVAEDVKAGDTLIAVPQQLLLHGELALQDAEYAPAFRQLVTELGPGTDSRHLLCVLLVLEKARGEASRWGPYIGILPEQYDDPYWWTDDQIALVKGTRLGRAIATHYTGLQHIAASVQRLEQLYSASQPAGSPPSVLRTYRNGWALGLHAARWARSTVWSRSFTVRMLASGARNVVAMVPVLDMIDHSPAMDVVWHTGPDGQEPFQFMPLAGACKGTVMSNNYGRKPSDELLLAYGFLLDGPNPADRLVVSLAHRRLGGPQAAGGMQPGQSGSGGTGGTHSHARLGGAGRGGPDDEAAGEEELAVQQQAAEDVQRNLTLMALGLSVDQQLSVADPLPATLLLGAQVCLLPAPQLYLWSAQLQNARRTPPQRPPSRSCSLPGTGAGPAPAVLAALPPPAQPAPTADVDMSGPSGEGAGGGVQGGGSTVGRKRPWQASQGGTSGDVSGGPPAGGPGAVRHLAALLAADSAMHIAAATDAGGSANGARQPGPTSNGNGVSAGGWPGCGSPTAGASPQAQGPAVHLIHRMQALVSMKQQLQSRLACMATEQQAQAARIHAAMSPRDGEAGGGRAMANGHASAGQLPAGLPAHSRLALQYLDLQKDLIRWSMAAVAEHTSAQVHAASALLRTCTQQRLISYRLLAAGRGAAYLPPSAQASAQTAEAGQGTGGPSCAPTWSCIDADLHLHQYQAWLRAWGLMPAQTCLGPGPAGDIDLERPSGGARTPMDVDVPANSGNAPTLTGEAPGSLGSCLLLETVHTRAAAPQFIARRSSRETLVQPDPPALPPAGAGSGAAAGSKPGGTARVRGPPSSSRTFTMKGAKPAALSPGLASPDAATPPAAAGGGAVPAAGSSTSRPPPAPLKRVSMPQGMGVTLGVDSDYDPVSIGVILARGAPAGTPMLRVPLECCLFARSRHSLLGALVSAAHSLLLSLVTAIRPYLLSHAVAAPGTSSAMAAACVPLPAQHDMLVWHLLHTVAAPPAARLYASDVEGVQLLAEMLEDSPAAGSYQEALDGLKADFTGTRKALAAAGLAGGKDGVLAKALSGPNSPNLYFWAKQVVDRAAVQVPLPGSTSTADAGVPMEDGGSSTGPQLWVLAPVVSSVCMELRDAVLIPELQPGTTPGDASPGRGAALVVRAACDLHAGLHLSPLMLLPGLDTEELMTTWGPEALPWQQLLHMSAAATARRALQRSSSSTTLHIPGAGDMPAVPAMLHANGNGHQTAGGVASGVAGGPASTAPTTRSPAVLESANPAMAHAAAVLHSRTVLYELYICPGERDPLCATKLQLLTASGLGCVHYLSIDLATEHLILCALKICLAGKELLHHPLAQQCIMLHAAANNQPGAVPPASGSSTPTAVVVGAGEAGAEGNALLPADSQAYQQLHALQPQLLDMLGALPEDLPVCKAARKQLRQMVHDARKNTRRRLKQLEAVHNVVANHVSSGGSGGGAGQGGSPANGLRAAAAQIVSALGGTYHPLGGSTAMHEGVRLYLSGVCDVLDTWADHLGLNRQSDSMSKRHKARHEDL